MCVRSLWNTYLASKANRGVSSKGLQRLCERFALAYRDLESRSLLTAEVRAEFHAYGMTILQDADVCMPHPEDLFSLLIIKTFADAEAALRLFFGPSMESMISPSHRAPRIEKAFLSIIEQLLARGNVEDALKIYRIFGEVEFPKKIWRRRLVPLIPLVAALVERNRGFEALSLLNSLTPRGSGTASQREAVPQHSRFSYSTMAANEPSLGKIAVERLFLAANDFGEWKDVMAIFEHLKKAVHEGSFAFTERSLHILLNAQFKGGRRAIQISDRIVDILKTMDDKGARRVFNAAINHLAKKGRLQEAIAMVKAMEDRGLTPDVFTVTALVSGHVRNKDLQSAMDAYGMARERNIRPDRYLVSELLGGIRRLGSVADATWLLRSLLIDEKEKLYRASCETPPLVDAVVCTNVLADRRTQGDPHLHEILDLTVCLIKRDVISLDYPLAVALLSHKFYPRRLKWIKEIFALMTRADLDTSHPDVLDVVISTYAKSGRAALALKFVKIHKLRQTSQQRLSLRVRTLRTVFKSLYGSRRKSLMLAWMRMISAPRLASHALYKDAFAALLSSKDSQPHVERALATFLTKISRCRRLSTQRRLKLARSAIRHVVGHWPTLAVRGPRKRAGVMLRWVKQKVSGESCPPENHPSKLAAIGNMVFRQY
ncbi:hypothetical protein HDU96_010883, partial [Phlyctochytrium bullatum]